jgi:hypothetical protein
VRGLLAVWVLSATLAAQELPSRPRMPDAEMESYRALLQSFDQLFRAVRGAPAPPGKMPAVKPQPLFRAGDESCSIPLLSSLIPKIPMRTVPPPRAAEDAMASYLPAPPCPAPRP